MIKRYALTDGEFIYSHRGCRIYEGHDPDWGNDLPIALWIYNGTYEYKDCRTIVRTDTKPYLSPKEVQFID